jgi:RNA polymerase primary sigma factor
MRALKITSAITRRDEKSLEKYLTEISGYDVLTPEEEYTLFRDYRSGDEQALSKLVLHNLRFVVSVAKKYQHMGLWLGDLINEGNIGLIKAATRFDETRGFKFISYAVWWIRQSILQAINEKSRKIRIPQNLQSQISKIMAKRAEILQKEEREPSIEELALALEIKPEVVEKCFEAYQKITSIDAPIRFDSDESMVAFMEDESIEKPDHSLSVEETQKEEVREMLKKLPQREATVISMYYGIGIERPISLNDIAEYIGLSRERVRQIKDKAVTKLRREAKSIVPTFSPN